MIVKDAVDVIQLPEPRENIMDSFWQRIFTSSCRWQAQDQVVCKRDDSSLAGGTLLEQ